jgi:hypothetical protein
MHDEGIACCHALPLLMARDQNRLIALRGSYGEHYKKLSFSGALIHFVSVFLIIIF